MRESGSSSSVAVGFTSIEATTGSWEHQRHRAMFCNHERTAAGLLRDLEHVRDHEPSVVRALDQNVVAVEPALSVDETQHLQTSHPRRVPGRRTRRVIEIRGNRDDRLVEFSALAHVTQIPWALATLAVSLWGWDPEPFRVSSATTVAELPDLLRRYQESMAAAPVQSTLRLVGAYFTVWLVALQCAALRVVSGVSVKTANSTAVLRCLVIFRSIKLKPVITTGY